MLLSPRLLDPAEHGIGARIPAATVTGELSLPRTLQVITDIARELVEARYAALGVPNEDGSFRAFITSGMDQAQINKMPHEPKGLGLLGAVLESDDPIRLVARRSTGDVEQEEESGTDQQKMHQRFPN